MHIEGDTTHTSTKLRLKSAEIIKKMGRPMAANEIEVWLRIHDQELWKEVSGKCEDYVRIILSLSKGGLIQKYRPSKPIHGIDRRATFYGLGTENYNSGEWSKFTPQPTRKPNRPPPQVIAVTSKSPPVENDNKDRSPFQKEIETMNKVFDNITEDDSWFPTWTTRT